MKKAFGLCLCVMLALCCAVSALAAVDYTLPEKLNKQLSIGSGLKGSFTISAEGNDPLVLALYPFLDTEIQLRSLTSEGETHCYFYQEGPDNAQTGLTEIYLKGNQLYARSDLLPGRVLSLPEMGALVDGLTKSAGENPAFASLLLNIHQQGEEGRVSTWEPLVSSLSRKLELWIARFETSTARISEDGSAVVELNYTIPMAELKKEILSLLSDIRQNPDFLHALEAVMTEEQKSIYLSNGLDYFYTDAMNALTDDFDVVLTRTTTTLGEVVSSSIELPLDGARFSGYTSLQIGSEGRTLTILLKNDEQVIRLVTEDGLFPENPDYVTWWYMTYPNRETESASTARSAMRIRYSRATETSTDTEGRDHQEDHYTLRTEGDTSRLPAEEKAGDYPEMKSTLLDVTLHYSSKNSQSSPTTLAVNASLKTGDMTLKLDGTFKSASPWIFSPFDISGAVNIMEMKPEERTLLLAEWLAGAGEQLVKTAELNAAETEAPAEETEAPAEETEAPAEETEAPAEETEAPTEETEAPAAEDQTEAASGGKAE